MKYTRLFVTAGLVMVLATTGTVAAAAGHPPRTASAALSESEAADLAFQREEEKLAHDVYEAMYANWQAKIFDNISTAEQRHADTMKRMLDQYNLPDSADAEWGVFNNRDLQDKFDELVTKGAQSFIDGLYVGATIEEIDMISLQDAIDGTTRIDLLTAYQNLMEGSKDHLRSYVKDLENQGVIYVPQYISQELYEAILGL